MKRKLPKVSLRYSGGKMPGRKKKAENKKSQMRAKKKGN